MGGGITNDNVITPFYWENMLSADGVTNVGYYDDVILIGILFALMKMD